VPGDVQGWRAVALLAAVGALVALSFLVSGPGGDDEGVPDSPTRGCAHAREEPGAGLREAERATLCLLNAERRWRGLRALRPERRLRVAALRHSRDMVRRQFLEHVNPDGVGHDERIARAGYRLDERTLAGENLATGEGETSAPAVIVDGWMHSPGHRRNILRPQFREIGIGIVPRSAETGEAGGTYTTTFGGRL
jgi:uncharacterized protein YkwD